eukprot:SAG31_NODE_688_length_12807_cov_6.395814_9_plen_251_part_00
MQTRNIATGCNSCLQTCEIDSAGFVATSKVQDNIFQTHCVVGGGCGAEVTEFFRGFKSRAFTGVFVATAVGWSATFVSFVFIQFYLADEIGVSEAASGSTDGSTQSGQGTFVLFGWDCASGADSVEQAAVAASGVYQGVYAVAAAVFALPGGMLSDGALGRRGTLALGFCLQAIGLGALVSNFTAHFRAFCGCNSFNLIFFFFSRHGHGALKPFCSSAGCSVEQLPAFAMVLFLLCMQVCYPQTNQHPET